MTTKITNIKEHTEETVSSRALAAINHPAGGMVELGGQEFKVTKHVTVPTLSHDVSKGIITVAVEFKTPFMESQSRMANASADARVNTARVINLTNGETMNYVGGVVVVSELKQAYPNDGYVGKKVLIRKLTPENGKRYNRVEILEIQ